MNASITVQHKHESAMKAVRVNGKITKVKQSALVNIKMADHLGSIHFEFFQWQKYYVIEIILFVLIQFYRTSR